MTLGSGRNWLKLRKIGGQSRLWLVVDGTTAMPGDVVCFSAVGWGMPAEGDDPASRLTPFDVDIVVDSVTGAVLLPESGTPASRFRQATQLVRHLEAEGLSDPAQIVRDWLQPTLEEEFRNRDAA